MGLIETVLATPEELTALGVPKGEVDQVAAAAGAAGQAGRRAAEGPERPRLDGQDRLEPARRPDAPPDPGRRRRRAHARPDPLRERGDLPRPGQRPGAGGQGRVPPGARDDQDRRDLEVRRASPRRRPRQGRDERRGRHPLVGLPPAGRRRQDGGANPEVEAALEGPGRLRQRQRQGPGAGRQQGPGPVPRRPDSPAPGRRQGRQGPRGPADLRQADRRQPGRRLPDGLLPERPDRSRRPDQGAGKVASYAAFRKVSAEFAAKNDEPAANPMATRRPG